MLLKKGQFVENKAKPEWGIGKVIDIKSQDRAEIFFQYAGYKIFVRKQNNLTEVAPEKVDSTIFENLHDRSHGAQRDDLIFRDIPSSKEYFLKNYPKGFKGKKYKGRERDYKDEGHFLAIELLNKKKP